ncbi:MAG: DNA replication/repair protein RecF [archaeon]|nr:DNA replication/repair protein RecF [archaeon]
MNITKIRLQNYRNYKDLEIELENGLNLFVGNNAQGKTNLLESIYVSSHGKSYRTSKDQELIKFGEDFLYIDIDMDKADREENIKIRITNNKEKNIQINNLKIKKLSDLVGYIKVITFKPEDLLLIKEGPNNRRKFLDTEISQIDTYYMQNLQKYNRALLQKNNYLKNTREINIDELSIWNNQLATYGAEIIKIRRNFIKEINELIKIIHSNITDEKENIEMIYEENVKEDNIMNKLEEHINQDIKYRSSQCGPHRDDFSFKINDIDVKKFGSQGQQRTSILSLLFSQIELIKNKTGELPILLLDDVLSELDEKRQMKMIEYINRMQTVLTCTEIKDEIKEKLNIKKIYYINEGNIQK